MWGKVCFTNARKIKVYKLKAFKLKNAKFEVQKSNNFLWFLDTWDQFSKSDFFLGEKKTQNKQVVEEA